MWLALFIFALAIAAILTMLISLSKQGDERRSMIVGKASAAAFVGAVGYVVACVVENFVQVWGAKGYAEGMNPLIALMVLASIYAVSLLYYKRRYGG